MSERPTNRDLAKLMLPQSRLAQKITKGFPRAVSAWSVLTLGVILIVAGLFPFCVRWLYESGASRHFLFVLVPAGSALVLFAGYRLLTRPSIERERRRAIEEWPELDRDLSPLLSHRRVVFRALVERGYRCAPVRRAIYERLRIDQSSR